MNDIEFPHLRLFTLNQNKSIPYTGLEKIESIRGFIETKIGIVSLKVSVKSSIL